MKKLADPFAIVVSKNKLNVHFKNVAESPGYAPARAVIRETFQTFDDSDGNFIEQFQTTGFDARIWELYLHAVLTSLGFSLSRKERRPDFMASKPGATVAIEAVTANPTQGARRPRPRAKWWKVNSPRTMRHKQRHLIPIKLGSALYSKLRKNYWTLSHVRGKPLIFALESFFEPGSLWFAGGTLAGYLYGFDNNPVWDARGKLHILAKRIRQHKHQGKVVPSGFFSLPGAEHVSAVMFSNSGTIAKFNRMGHQGRYRAAGITMLRFGTCYDHDANSALPCKFFYEVGDPRFPEDWPQGVALFHNPRATNPLPRDLFPDVMHARSDAGVLKSVIPLFFPLNSVTHVLQPRGARQASRSHRRRSTVKLPTDRK